MLIEKITEHHQYRNVFLAEDRNCWQALPFPYDRQQDLVLSFDFGLVQQIDAQGGNAAYLDHIVDPQVMEVYNHEMYRFFARWYQDEQGRDIFLHQGIKVGNAFSIEILNDLTYYARVFISLATLQKAGFREILVSVADNITINILKKLGFEYKTWSAPIEKSFMSYYFPIFQWNSEKINDSVIKRSAKQGIVFLGNLFLDFQQKFKQRQTKPKIFLHNYHPTQPLIEALRQSGKLEIINESIGKLKDIFKQRRLPAWRSSRKNKYLAKAMIAEFQARRHETWEIEGVEIGGEIIQLFIDRISGSLPYYLTFVDSIMRFFAKRPIELAVPISNIGRQTCLVQNYCEAHGIPRYLIINGLLANGYFNESKEATWINSYGESIRDNYFKGMDNVVCLGDPRMDSYADEQPFKKEKSFPLTILIGAAGYGNIDLNSHIGFEFAFIKDVLEACRILIQNGLEMNLMVKVRPNGYIDQYSRFCREYFPDLEIVLHDLISFREIAKEADFYISIYSQTLFEASCLGVPVLYYKKDTHLFFPPFDGKSELVTAFSTKDLVEKITLFYQGDPLYASFMDKEIMAKYVGQIDGGNVERNLRFINSLCRGVV